MPDSVKKILILGGTAESRMLAERLEAAPGYFPVSSVAGLTRNPEALAGEIHSGSFGGASGMADFIERHGIAAVVDATHPFAQQISANALKAAGSSGVPCLRLERPRWEAQGGDEWTIVPDIATAAGAIPAGARAFVTVGRKEAGAFFARDDIFILARMIERPEDAVPQNAEIMLTRPPFTLAQEKTLMASRDISILVTKNSGGDATRAKIVAARDLSLPVIMVERPVKPETPTVSTVDDMIGLLNASLP